MAAAGILNHASFSSKLQGVNGVPPMATSGENQNSASGTQSSSAGITANDFLTLLVTEMKNQDPTANTDPNQYINQLVNVNSLQQLIGINETLTSAFGSSSVTAYSHANSNLEPKSAAASSTMTNPSTSTTAAPAEASLTSQSAGTSADPKVYTIVNNLAHGNLSAPRGNPAAERLAHALDRRSTSN